MVMKGVRGWGKEGGVDGRGWGQEGSVNGRGMGLRMDDILLCKGERGDGDVEREVGKRNGSAGSVPISKES